MPRRVWTGTRPTHEVDLGGGDYVSVYSKMTIHDRAVINEAIVEGHITTETVTGQDGKNETKVQLGELRLGATNIATLVRVIQSWRGPGFCADHDHDAAGAPPYRENAERAPVAEGQEPRILPACNLVPLTVQAVDMLDDTTARQILEYVEAQNPQPKQGGAATP
jgi:hypothetical protein